MICDFVISQFNDQTMQEKRKKISIVYISGCSVMIKNKNFPLHRECILCISEAKF